MKVALRLLVAFLAVAAAPAVYAESELADAVALSTATSLTAATPVTAATTIATKLQTGLASYYARGFEGMRTASGEIFRHAANMAAHPTWPLGTVARVTNLTTGRSVEVRINDRGPSTSPRKKGVIIDLSQSAAHELDMIRAGLARVTVEVIEWGNARR